MRRSLFLFAFLFFVAGCGQSSFVGKRLDNFTAYYNTFYNAEHAFEEGVRAIETGAENQPVDQNVYLPVFGSSDRPIQGKTFESAIKKSADVLRKHPQSKWVDDALLLIGKARFYTGDYVGAEEKFREVMTLDSRLGDEAHFWLARTLIVSDQYEAAADHLQESLNRESLSKRWEPMFHLALGEMYVQRSAWEDATAELEAGLESVKDNAVAARAQFLLGQVYESLGRYAEAVASYERVVRYNPFYELSYAAQVSAIRVEGLYGDTDAALRMLRRMERDDKNYANRAELAYLRGRIYQAAGHADDALDTYYEVLYDSDANITPVRGRVHYALGELYRDLYVDYSLAAAHFDTAAVALQGTSGRGGRRVGNVPGTARQQAFAPSAITDGNEQQRTFRSFADVMDQTSRMDSLLYLGSLDEEAFEARVLELRQEEAERLAEEQARMERLRAERQFQNAGNFNQRGRNNRGESKQTGSSQREDNSAGFLFHRDQARVQEGRADFTLRWGDRPLVPNWRRAAALSNLTGEEAEGGGGVPADENLDLPGAGLPEIDIASVPRDSLSRRQMRADRAVARYELANVLFLSMNRPDSAAVWYRMVIEEDGDEPVAQRAYYALAEVQRALGDTLSARRLYQTILDTYPDSDFAGRARERLGLPETIVISDSLVLAEEAYDRAYGAWRSAAYEQSLNEMVDMAIRYSQTDVAPRALFAAGSIYMEWATRDSLSLFDPLPLAIPDSVIQASLLFQPPPVPIQQQARGNIPPRRGTTQELQAGLPPGKVIDVSEDRQGLPPGKVIDTPTEQDDLPPGNVIGPAPAGVDSLAADSLAQTEEIIADSLAGPEKAHLETLYTALRAWYPRSLQAPQAGRILNVLKERQAEIQA
ncbi:MAG: tetratricopeptide repeat protein, partial [Rhodothermales bacterium]